MRSLCVLFKLKRLLEVVASPEQANVLVKKHNRSNCCLQFEKLKNKHDKGVQV